MEKVKEYTNGEVTIVWKPGSCIHSAICVGGLPNVFQPNEKPWIKIEAASTQELIDQIKKCPSGALSSYINGQDMNIAESLETKVEVMKDGPLLVYGKLNVTRKDGSKEIKNKTTAFCRCGLSNNKPYCDGTHSKEDFVG